MTSYSEDAIIDAGHALAWVDHDIALLLSTLEELADDDDPRLGFKVVPEGSTLTPWWSRWRNRP